MVHPDTWEIDGNQAGTSIHMCADQLHYEMAPGLLFDIKGSQGSDKMAH